jgi:hypothetical protein
VKDVEGLADLEGLVVSVLPVRERRGVFMLFERWKLDRRVVGSLAAPRTPSEVVRSILKNGAGRGSWESRGVKH